MQQSKPLEVCTLSLKLHRNYVCCFVSLGNVDFRLGFLPILDDFDDVEVVLEDIYSRSAN